MKKLLLIFVTLAMMVAGCKVPEAVPPVTPPPVTPPIVVPPGPYSETRKFIPTLEQQSEARLALGFLTSEKAAPVLYKIVLSPVMRQTPQKIFEGIRDGKETFIMDLRYALVYYDVVCTKVGGYWQNTASPQSPPKLPGLQSLAGWGTKA